VPYGGACLPKDTTAFMAFVREHGWNHLMLEATIAANQQLAAHVPAAPSPDKIDEALAVARQHAALEPGDLVLQLGGTPAIVL
jgi:hypothetical protein